MSRTKKTPSRTEPQQGIADELKKRELSNEEQVRLEAFRQRAGQTKPVKFKSRASSTHPGGIAAADLDDPLIPAKLAEASGSSDADAQGLLSDQVVQAKQGHMMTKGKTCDVERVNPGRCRPCESQKRT